MEQCDNCCSSIWGDKNCPKCNGIGYIVAGSLEEQNKILREIIIEQRECIGNMSMDAAGEDA
jgi:hypothetical protein